MLKVQEIREIIKLIDQSSIDEFTYETSGTSITMKKNKALTEYVTPQNVVTQNTDAVPATQIQTTEQPKTQNETPSDVSTPSTPTVDFDYEIVSPMVGTFYSKPSPESDPYVHTGSKVNPETVVCIVEAMKLFNEIEAEVSGEIVEILVKDGELVEYNQPLFRVKNQ